MRISVVNNLFALLSTETRSKHSSPLHKARRANRRPSLHTSNLRLEPLETRVMLSIDGAEAVLMAMTPPMLDASLPTGVQAAQLASIQGPTGNPAQNLPLASQPLQAASLSSMNQAQLTSGLQLNTAAVDASIRIQTAPATPITSTSVGVSASTSKAIAPSAAACDAVLATLSSTSNAVKEATTGSFMDGLVDFGRSIFSKLYQSLVNTLANKLESVLKYATDQLVGAIGTLGTKLANSISSLGEKVGPAINAMAGKLENAIISLGGKIETALGTVATKVIDAIGSLGSRLESMLVSLAQKLGPTLSACTDRLVSAMSACTEKFHAAMATVAEKVGPALTAVADRLGNAMTYCVDKLSSTLIAIADRLHPVSSASSAKLAGPTLPAKTTSTTYTTWWPF